MKNTKENREMKRRILFSGIGMVLLLLACQHGETNVSPGTSSAAMQRASSSSTPTIQMPVEAYLDWFDNKDHGLRVEKTIGDLTFSALYKPHEYLAAMELKKEKITKQKLNEKMKDYEGLQYFTFRITADNEQQELLKKGIQSDQDYYSRIEYFSFGMQKDFTLVDGSDTLECALYHFERVYGLAPYATMVLGFPLTKQAQDGTQKVMNEKIIGYSDKVFGAGNVYMRIKAEDLNNIPQFEIQ